MSKKDKNKKNKKNLWLSILAVILLIVLIAVAAFFAMKNKNKEDENTLAYTELIKQISYGNVEKIEMTTGSTSVKVKMKGEEEEKTAIVPETESFMELIQTKVAEGNEIELVQKPRNALAQIPSILFSVLPTILMVILVVMIIKMQGLGEKGKIYDDTERKTKVKFDDVAGLDEEKQEMIEIVDF